MKIPIQIAMAAATIRDLQRSLNVPSNCQTHIISPGILSFYSCIKNDFSDLDLESITVTSPESCTNAFHKNRTLQCLPILLGSNAFEVMEKLKSDPPPECTDAEWKQMQEMCGGGSASGLDIQNNLTPDQVKSSVNNLFAECEKVVPGVTTSELSPEETETVKLYLAENMKKTIKDDQPSTASSTNAMMILVAAILCTSFKKNT